MASPCEAFPYRYFVVLLAGDVVFVVVLWLVLLVLLLLLLLFLLFL